MTAWGGNSLELFLILKDLVSAKAVTTDPPSLNRIGISSLSKLEKAFNTEI